MLCVFCLESKLPRIAPGGIVSAGYPALTPIMDVPCVPRVGEEVFLLAGSDKNRHTVTGVRYLIEAGKMTGAQVLVSDGTPIE
jgi:hypothetical protein